MKNVIFDLDGTLADTSADLIAAANACFIGLGQGALLDPVADAKTGFAGGRAMLRLGFSRMGGGSEADIDTQFPLLLRHYADHIDTHTTLYDGVEAALDELAARGYLLGICTNKPVDLAETLVMRLGIRDRFGALLGADSLPVRKPDPQHLWQTIDDLGGARARSVLIGDTITDARTAENARVPCVLVSFGPEGSGVQDMPAAALLDHFDDLPDLIDQLTG